MKAELRNKLFLASYFNMSVQTVQTLEIEQKEALASSE